MITPTQLAASMLADDARGFDTELTVQALNEYNGPTNDDKDHPTTLEEVIAVRAAELLCGALAVELRGGSKVVLADHPLHARNAVRQVLACWSQEEDDDGGVGYHLWELVGAEPDPEQLAMLEPTRQVFAALAARLA